jgi:hypothetical protein
MNKKLQYGSLLLLVMYTLFFLFLKLFFLTFNPYDISKYALILAILCLVNLFLSIIFIFKNRDENKFIKLAYWLNFFPLILFVLV